MGGNGVPEYFEHVDDMVLPEDFPEVPVVCGATPAPTPDTPRLTSNGLLVMDFRG